MLGARARRFRAAVIGSPVSHSLSPAIHEAAYGALGLDWRYGAIEVQKGAASRAIHEAQVIGYVGLSVTTPLKTEVAGASSASEDVEAIGAANTVVFGSDGTRAHNTDGEGLLDDLKSQFGFDPSGTRCGVIGAGATGRAVIRSLYVHGAKEIVVVNRSMRKASAAAALAPLVAHIGIPGDLRGFDLIIYGAKPASPEDPGELAEFASAVAEALQPGKLAVDVNYFPARSSFLEAARAKGAVTRNGLGMLVHQAARQVELFTGSPAPIETMWRAVLGGSKMSVTRGPA
ncbi:MAG: shikimate dehydrogenase [Acidimicrobiales bacterium]